MLIKFYKFDGITPYEETRTVMIGGTQEDPILGNVTKPLVVMCPNRKVGEAFFLTTNGGWSRPRFHVFEEGKAKRVL
tara:strand:+ start:328 stop:558 length:231 start_codon:yes stop_codon:yes gene_type:complete